jgi:7-cyano-7-deazaguanine reductase
LEALTQLGSKVHIPDDPDHALLETFQNPDKVYPYCVRFTCVEFTSLCPVTNQPDFARIIIDYVPKDIMIESKSLKLFLHSFRNYNCFHERCVSYIGKRLNTALIPHWLRVVGFFEPRGGIPIDVFYSIGKVPDGVTIPDVTSNYLGRR